MLLIVRTLKTQHLWLHFIPASLLCHFSIHISNFLNKVTSLPKILIIYLHGNKGQDICFEIPLYFVWLNTIKYGFCIANMKIPGLLFFIFVDYWKTVQAVSLILDGSDMLNFAFLSPQRNFSFLSICLSKIGSSLKEIFHIFFLPFIKLDCSSVDW